MAGKRIVVGGIGDAGATHAVARSRRDAGDEVILLGDGLEIDQLGRTAVAEDAAEVVLLGSDVDAARLRAWLRDHGANGVDVNRVEE